MSWSDSFHGNNDLSDGGCGLEDGNNACGQSDLLYETHWTSPSSWQLHVQGRVTVFCSIGEVVVTLPVHLSWSHVILNFFILSVWL